jgi:hypothetical protein
MASPLRSLLDLRRAAEERAMLVFDRAALARAAAEAEQRRLVAGWRQALARWDGERERLAAVGATAGQAMTRAGYLDGLTAEVARAARLAEGHRAGALATAVRVETEARAVVEQAHAAVEAARGALAREQAEATRREQRRAEDSVCDLAQAAFVRERGQRGS